MGLTHAQRYNIVADCIYFHSVVLKHELWGEYTEKEYQTAKARYNELRFRYPNLTKAQS
jgi:hypothetical protein